MNRRKFLGSITGMAILPILELQMVGAEKKEAITPLPIGAVYFTEEHKDHVIYYLESCLNYLDEQIEDTIEVMEPEENTGEEFEQLIHECSELINERKRIIGVLIGIAKGEVLASP